MKLHFRRYGQGPPMIILHGLFGSSDNWHRMSRCWGEHFSVYAIDQRNHGNSPHVPGMNYNLLCGDLADFLATEIRKPAILVGHSMGGKTAMLFASREPEMVKALVVLDIGIKLYEPRHVNILQVLKDTDLHAFTTRAEIDAALKPKIGPSAVRQLLLKNITRENTGDFRWKFNHTAILLDYQKLVAEIPIEEPYEGTTHFLRGARSDYILDRDWPLLQNFFPRAELHTVEGAGHWLHAEKPNEVCQLVAENLLSCV